MELKFEQNVSSSTLEKLLIVPYGIEIKLI